MPDKTQLIPARVAHNRRLLDEFLERNGSPALFPQVSAQHCSIPITGIFDGGYNPSIARHNGRLVCAYRYHHDGTASTRLAICELDDKFATIDNQAINLNETALSHEDPRLFVFQDSLWMSYIASEWPHFPAAKVRYVRLSKPDHWRADSPIDYTFPEMNSIEKNHIQFPLGGGIGIIYRHNPKQVIYEPLKTKPVVSDALTWPWGEIRGGTAPMPFGEHLLKFFHSRLDNDMPPVRHRYYIGAMLMNPVSPYNMVAVSKRPILFGSEKGGDRTRKHFKPNVVFPAGAVKDGTSFLISVGVNDSTCEVVEISEKGLNL